MPTVDEVVRLLDEFAPPALAEEWDNVGLLVGDRGSTVRRLMTCLTLTPTTAAEAIEHKADLIVVHHPLPFRPVSQITTDTTVGRLLWELIGARAAVYSPHTSFDSARGGINQLLAVGFGLTHVEPLAPIAMEHAESTLGAGRCGTSDMPLTLAELAERVKTFLSIEHVRLVGRLDQPVHRVAVACGSGASFLPVAQEMGCDALVTGEATFHACLEAEAIGVGLILAGHFASERFALERLADSLDAQFPDVQIWASEREEDPLHLF
jgi:dinuclear metal center YbgI/SA1388 family protein